jgi:hypothetical protein
LDDVVAEIEAELTAEGLAVDLLHDIAEDAAAAEDKARVSKSTSGQLDLLTGDEESLEGMWRLGGRTRVQVRHARRRDYLTHLGAQEDNGARVMAALSKAHREAAELLPYMVDELVTVEEAARMWRRDNPGGA